MFPEDLRRSRSSGRVPRKDYSKLTRLARDLDIDLDKGAQKQARAKIKPKVKKSIKNQAVQESTDPNSDISKVKQATGRQKRKRVLVDHNRVSERVEAEADNEYERQREERIKRNSEFIRQLGLKKLVADLTDCIQRSSAGGEAQRRGPRPKRQPQQPLEPVVVRKSCRQRGLAPVEGDAEEEARPEAETRHESLMTSEDYFKWKGQEIEGYKVEGHFSGWVNPAICEQYGIAGSAEEAWESNGGGKFTFKIDKKAIPAEMKSKGWSDARAFAATQLKKNPNTYFYRHVAPHEQQAQGEWTEAEHALFMETVRKHGVGDKWGLFSSYIPERVGYQCSAYYREVIIPGGWVLDPKFKMSRNGRAVYIG